MIVMPYGSARVSLARNLIGLIPVGLRHETQQIIECYEWLELGFAPLNPTYIALRRSPAVYGVDVRAIIHAPSDPIQWGDT